MPGTCPAIREVEPPSDVDLVRGIQAGDPGLLDELHSRHRAVVFATAWRITRNESLAEEATQDVFMQVWRTAASFDPERGAVRTWLLVMARARALDRLRSERRSGAHSSPLDPATDQLPHPAGGADGELFDAQETVAMNRLLGVLPPKDRRMLGLALHRGLSHSQLASALEQPLGTVKTRMRRLVRLVRHAMRGESRTPFAWASTTAPAEHARKRLENLTVLVVDDDPDTLTLVRLVLQRAGAVVVTADSASQARRRLSSISPDIILADLDMPHEDGCSLMRHVRSNTSGGARVPAAAFTAHGHDEDRRRTGEAGFDAHLVKPIRPWMLVRQVAELALLRP